MSRRSVAQADVVKSLFLPGPGEAPAPFFLHKGAQGCTSLHNRPFLRCGSPWNGFLAFRKPAYVNEHPPFPGHVANIQQQLRTATFKYNLKSVVKCLDARLSGLRLMRRVSSKTGQTSAQGTRKDTAAAKSRGMVQNGAANRLKRVSKARTLARRKPL